MSNHARGIALASSLLALCIPAAAYAANASDVSIRPVASGARADGGNTVVAELEFALGGYISWHTHPGLTTIVVKEGTLTLVRRSCERTTYGPGDAFIAPRAAHTARNLSGSEDLGVMATFVVRGTVPTVFEPAETQAALDAKCGLS